MQVSSSMQHVMPDSIGMSLRSYRSLRQRSLAMQILDRMWGWTGLLSLGYARWLTTPSSWELCTANGHDQPPVRMRRMSGRCTAMPHLLVSRLTGIKCACRCLTVSLHSCAPFGRKHLEAIQCSMPQLHRGACGPSSCCGSAVFHPTVPQKIGMPCRPDKNLIVCSSRQQGQSRKQLAPFRQLPLQYVRPQSETWPGSSRHRFWALALSARPGL